MENLDYIEIFKKEGERRMQEMLQNNEKYREKYKKMEVELGFSSIMRNAWLYEYPLYLWHRQKNWFYTL